MELIKSETESYFFTYGRQGNDRNGNPIYIVNIFKTHDATTKTMFFNYNPITGRRLDKYGNIRITSYNIIDTIENIIKSIK